MRLIVSVKRESNVPHTIRIQVQRSGFFDISLCSWCLKSLILIFAEPRPQTLSMIHMYKSRLAGSINYVVMLSTSLVSS